MIHQHEWITCYEGAVFDKDGDGQRDEDDDADLMAPTNTK